MEDKVIDDRSTDRWEIYDRVKCSRTWESPIKDITTLKCFSKLSISVSREIYLYSMSMEYYF